MTNSNLITEIDDRGRATLTMNRPELHNAFDDALIAAMTAELRRLEAEPRVRVVLLAARGKSFSAGADLNWMRQMAGYSWDDNFKDAMNLAELMQTLDGLAKPTVALVQGAAFGGGVGLVACCDVALASENASFCLSEVKLGLIPGAISPYVVAAIGARAARRYFQTAERFDAARAHHLGLVHEVVAPQQLREQADSLCELMLKNGPEAMAAAKDLVGAVSRGKIDQHMIADTAERIAGARAGSEGREGLAAFLEKRRPAWVKG